MQTPTATIDGYLERSTARGASIRSLGGLPAVGEAGQLNIEAPAGGIEASVVVTRVDAAEGLFHVTIDHVESGGPILLALDLLGGGGEDAEV